MIIPARNLYTTTVNKWFLRSLRALQKIKLRFSGNLRPSSYPYISGDSFRSLANFIHDETGTFCPEDVKNGDIVFVGNPFMQEYFSNLHPKIQHPYILIQHNGDFVVDQKIANLLDEKVIHFFAQNAVVEHPKITPIPIGVTNKSWSAAGMPWTYTRKPAKHKLPRILFSFSTETNPAEREPALKYLLQHPCADKPKNFLAANEHTKLLNQYSFVASPPGQGPESARTWEALYMKTIPITKPFIGICSFKELGLPIWIINEWSELDNFTETGFKEIYERMMRDTNFDSLYMDFWIKKINKYKLN